MDYNSDGGTKDPHKKFKNGDAKIDIELNKTDAKAKENEKDQDDDKEKEDELPPVAFFQLFRYATKYEKFLMCFGVVAAMASGVCTPLLFVIFGNITDAFVYNAMLEAITNNTLGNLTLMYPNITDEYPEFENATTVEEVREIFKEIFDIGDFFNEVVKFGVGTIGIAVAQMVCGYVFVATMNYAAEGQVYRLRGTFLKSILRQEIGYFDTRETNDFASKVTENLNKLQEGIGEKVGMFVFFMTIFLASIIVAFVHGWLLTLVILSVFPLLGLSIGILTKIQVKLSATEMKAYAKAGSVAEQAISSIRTVFAFGGEAKEMDGYNNNLVSARKAGVNRGFVTGAGIGFVWFFIYASYSLAFYYGTGLILDSRPPNGDGSFEPSNLMIVFFSVLMGAMNVGQSAPYVEAFNVARGAAAAVFDIIERKSAIDPTSTSGRKPSSVTGTIELKDVHFNYPSRPDVQILKGATLRVEPGQTVALVGASGCGKSTCIQLIQRFYDPLSGRVLLDGEDIRDLNVGWLRDQIGIVGQEPVLFATTIAENIRYGQPSATMEDIEMAAKEANAHDFIMKLPKKYKTNVGERGAQISGGQKQRIAIARALVKQPRVLLLDEATSALDNQSEAIVQKALDKVRLGRSTIVVAHRLSTIRTADKIVVFSKGQIEEEGTHDELMKLHNLYYNLVTAQIGPLALQKQISTVSKDGSPANDDELNEDVMITEFTQEILDDVTSMSPASLAHSPSIRESVRRRRRASSVKSVKSVKSETKEEDEDYEPVSMIKILKWNSTEWHLIVGGVICAAIQGATMPVYAVLIGEVMGTMSVTIEDEARKEANFYSLLFLIIGIIVALATFCQAYLFALSGETMTTRLRKLSFAAMLKQEAGWYDEEKNSVGALCSRLSGDAAAVQGATGSRIGTIVQSITVLTISIVLAVYYDWRLGLLTLPFIPIVLGAVYFQAKLLMGQSITQNKVLQDAGKIAIQAITNIRTVAGLHKEVYFAAEYSHALLKPHKLALKQSHLRGIIFGFASAVPLLAFSCIMFYGGYLVSINELDYASVFKVAEVLMMGTMTVGQAIAFAPNFTKAKVSAGKIYSLLHRHPVIDSSVGVGLRLGGPVEKVELHDVHFSYPTRPDVAVLNGLSLLVDKGKTVALVGSSGCGKSTVIGLLERFYDASKGQVCINNQDVQGLNVGFVRNQLGLVSQEPVLFDRSIAENIAYGDNSRTVGELEIMSAAKQANIHEFVKSLPDQYETRVGTKGTQLSGGQKQRIAIARALIRNPGVLLLDEATSALDAESEKVVQKALESAQEGRTSIIIAHRLSTIQGADVIAVIQGGCVVEAGTHNELILKKGHYYKLYKTNH